MAPPNTTVKIERAAWIYSNCALEYFDERWDDFLLKVAAVLKASGATLFGREIVKYVPHGATVVFFLAESHAVLTTWPEHRLMLFELTSCEANINYSQLSIKIEGLLESDNVQEI